MPSTLRGETADDVEGDEGRGWTEDGGEEGGGGCGLTSDTWTSTHPERSDINIQKHSSEPHKIITKTKPIKSHLIHKNSIISSIILVEVSLGHDIDQYHLLLIYDWDIWWCLCFLVVWTILPSLPAPHPWPMFRVDWLEEGTVDWSTLLRRKKFTSKPSTVIEYWASIGNNKQQPNTENDINSRR